MKAINIQSVADAKTYLNREIGEKYLLKFQTKPKDADVEVLTAFVNELKSNEMAFGLLDNYFFGYSIPQISKEFDLLRIGLESVVNIELKREANDEKIKKQLTQNLYYLKALNKTVISYSYVANSRKLYKLQENGELVITNFGDLISDLSNQIIDEISSVDNLFDPSQYLVSPFNSTQKFLNNEYFLTDNQERIKKDIDLLLTQQDAGFIAISGGAGTGKTLLIYDIAKNAISKNQNVLIVHCGYLNDGHAILNQTVGWHVIQIKDLNREDLSQYSFIIVDEAQRIYKTQLDKLIDDIKNLKSKCIFSYDSAQRLQDYERTNNLETVLEQLESCNKFESKEKIRTNINVATFIRALFNKTSQPSINIKQNIDISYFKNDEDGKNYLVDLEKDGWKVINYTPDCVKKRAYQNHSIPLSNERNSHTVIGQEFEKVAVLIGRYFTYDDNQELAYHGACFYDPVKMLFQNVTRTRKKLHIVIVDNEELLTRCLQVLADSN